MIAMRLLCRSILLAVASMLLSSCFLWPDGEDYRDAREARPLEVPPEMSEPDTTEALRVPDSQGQQSAPAGGGAAGAATGGAEVPPAAGEAASTRAADGSDADSSGQVALSPGPVPVDLYRKDDQVWLIVQDSMERTWRRTRAALERSALELTGEDEARRLYRVQLQAAPEDDDGGFFSWLFGGDEDVSGTYHVSLVGAKGGRTRVEVLDADGNLQGSAAAERILQALRDQMS